MALLERQRLFDRQVVVHNTPESLSNCGRVGVLDDFAAVNSAGGSLRKEAVRAREDLAVTDLASAASPRSG
ncbi:MAG: hypothetical protein EXS42_05795 [Lacunisphaera sp.]|nr:hypothetical protein [Lacunisphaera sp.]